MDAATQEANALMAWVNDFVVQEELAEQASATGAGSRTTTRITTLASRTASVPSAQAVADDGDFGLASLPSWSALTEDREPTDSITSSLQNLALDSNPQAKVQAPRTDDEVIHAFLVDQLKRHPKQTRQVLEHLRTVILRPDQDWATDMRSGIATLLE
jgi:hypothetical protein